MAYDPKHETIRHLVAWVVGGLVASIVVTGAVLLIREGMEQAHKQTIACIENGGVEGSYGTCVWSRESMKF